MTLQNYTGSLFLRSFGLDGTDGKAGSHFSYIELRTMMEKIAQKIGVEREF